MDGHGLEPLGTVLGYPLLEEERALGAVGEPFQNGGPLPDPLHDPVPHRQVVANQV